MLVMSPCKSTNISRVIVTGLYDYWCTVNIFHLSISIVKYGRTELVCAVYNKVLQAGQVVVMLYPYPCLH